MNTLGPYLCSQMLFETLGILIFQIWSPLHFFVLDQDGVENCILSQKFGGLTSCWKY